MCFLTVGPPLLDRIDRKINFMNAPFLIVLRLSALSSHAQTRGSQGAPGTGKNLRLVIIAEIKVKPSANIVTARIEIASPTATPAP